MNYATVMDTLKHRVSKTMVLQWLSALFLCLIVIQVVQGFNFFSTLQRMLKFEDVTQNTPSSGTQIGQHAKYHLFGDYIPTNLDVANVRQSTLNFVVSGILYAPKEEDSQVILQEPSGKEHFFSVGDKLPGGEVIKRITADGVLVSKNGELERLNLPQDELRFDELPEPLVNE